MAGEKVWVESLKPRIEAALGVCAEENYQVRVCAGEKVAYAYEVHAYGAEDKNQTHVAKYETDLLLYDARDDGAWIPRVVVEGKLGAITTHDALTYSTKAATHKHVHPYLRYGILVGEFDNALPGRLMRHGAYFDFMMAWVAREPAPTEWRSFIEVLIAEVRASRLLQSLLTGTRSRSRPRFQLLHRPLVLWPAPGGVLPAEEKPA